MKLSAILCAALAAALLVSAQELPDLPLAGLSGSGMSVAHKWDLRGALLQEIWEGRSGVR